MADEFRHGDVVSGRITENEYEAIGEHIFNSQATGDMLIATSVTQLSRLGITNDRILVSSGGLFSWDNTLPAFTLGGTVTLSGQAFDAGAGYEKVYTTGSYTQELKATNDGNTGVRILTNHVSTTPAAEDWLYRLEVSGYDLDTPRNRVAYGRLNFMIEDATADHAYGKFEIRLLEDQSDNLAMTLSGAGALWVDQDISFTTSLDSALVADKVSLGGYEIAAGQRSLAISQENPVVNAAAGASDNYLPVRINGATYKLLLHS